MRIFMEKALEPTKLENFLERICNKYLKKKFVYGTTEDKREELGPLLVRYYLFDGGDKYPSLYIHKLCRSDAERDLHDHPWWFFTFLMTGGYLEETPFEVTEFDDATIINTFKIEYREPRRLYFRPATWTHRLLLVKPVWTLVLRGKTSREWGFYTQSGWINSKNYKLDKEFKDDDERNIVGVQPTTHWEHM